MCIVGAQNMLKYVKYECLFVVDSYIHVWESQKTMASRRAYRPAGQRRETSDPVGQPPVGCACLLHGSTTRGHRYTARRIRGTI